MNKDLLQIDFSKAKSKEEDLVEIKLGDEEVLQIHFWKFYIQSKYLQTKYKYSEAFYSIQEEIDSIENQNNVSSDSLKHFIELVETSKSKFGFDEYKDIYKLSEHFCIQKIINELDNLNDRSLFNDLNFTIQILQDCETSSDEVETKLSSKIENFLRERIDECISNSKFGELPVSTIFRILHESKEKLDHNLLVDFIFESASTRFILFKIVELCKLRDDKIDELIELIDEQEETTKKMYLEYMPFSLSFIKNMRNKYDQLLKENKQINEELKQTKIICGQKDIEINQTKEELKQTKIICDQKDLEINQTKEELKQTKIVCDQKDIEINQAKEELKQTKIVCDQKDLEINQTKEELKQTKIICDQKDLEIKQTKIKHEQTKEELIQYKRDLKQVKDEYNRVKFKNKQNIQSIFVCGRDTDNQLGENPNNTDKDGKPIISPPVKSSIDPSSLQSYSAYCWHSLMITNDGSLKGVGNNKYVKFSPTLQKTGIDHFTDFCIKDGSGCQLAAISAVCCVNGALYMFSKSSGIERQLVLCDRDINDGDPVFLDIGNHHPVSLFGGCLHSAAIGSEGEVIFINRYLVKKSPNSPIAAVSLPNGEKASSVACCKDSVVVLSSNGRVFTSPVESNGVLKFSIVSELSGQKIVCVSGAYDHFLAVNKNGCVFGCGSNESGKLGLGKETYSVSSFTKIQSLVGYKIRAAYAGCSHSLFETREGKILSCGCNFYGELLLSSGPGEDVYSPTETTITRGASFCIAGAYLSVVFIGDSPPPSTPNMRVH